MVHSIKAMHSTSVIAFEPLLLRWFVKYGKTNKANGIAAFAACPEGNDELNSCDWILNQYLNCVIGSSRR